MARPALWTAIAQALTEDISSGRHRPGDRLPTEAQLAERYGVNRHTVRRALADLVDRGLVRTRRGAGAFVHTPVTDYPLGERVRFRQNILAAGKAPGRRMLSIGREHADAEIAVALGLGEGAPVFVARGLSLVDGIPIARFTSWFPAARLPRFADELGHCGSVTQALAACGVHDYTRASTRVDGCLADAADATLLETKPGVVLLRTTSVNHDATGTPIEFGKSLFVADRVTLTIEP